jgi:rSAM/selenodomain-associated transferase 1
MASSEPLPEKVAIAVFAKAPVPGQAKTRLTGLLGADGAAALQAGLVRRALSTAVTANVGPVSLFCAPDEHHPFFARCAEQFRVVLVPQAGKDLGERMHAAFRDAFAAESALIVIGSDCPALTIDDLRAARAALREAPAVITPAEDGGYVLIGLARDVPRLFSDVAWGTGAVLRETRARFTQAGVRCIELPERWDVDRPEDYARLRAEGLLEEVLS